MSSMCDHGTGDCNQGSRHCKYPICRENKLSKTLPRIRCTCSKTEGLRSFMHNRIRTQFVNLFRAKDQTSLKKSIIQELQIERIPGIGGYILWSWIAVNHLLILQYVENVLGHKEKKWNFHIVTISRFQQKQTINKR